MESGIVFDIQNLSLHDGPGLRTTVFLKGCPLKCLWCANPESQKLAKQVMIYEEKCTHCGECIKACPTGAIKTGKGCTGCGKCVDACLHGARKMVGRKMTTNEVMDKVIRDKVFYKKSGGGVTFSGGECLMQPQFLLELLKKSKEESLHTVIDTTAYCKPSLFQEIIPYVDLAYVDMKCIISDKHKEMTDVHNEWILENIKYMDENGCSFDIRMPIIPGYNDADDIIDQTISFLQELKSDFTVWLLPFHAYGKAKYPRIGMKWPMGDMPNLEREKLEPMAEKFRNAGLKAEIQ